MKIFAVTFLLWVTVSLVMVQFKIVADGKPLCIIESPENPTITQTFAANELAAYTFPFLKCALVEIESPRPSHGLWNCERNFEIAKIIANLAKYSRRTQ